MERGHSFDYMQTDKDFFSPEYIRHILVKLRPWKRLVLISLSAVSEAPTSEELGVETQCRGRFRYSDLKEAALGDYGICIWRSPS